MGNFWPNITTIERELAHDDKYTFFYKGKPCYISLDSRGLFHGKAGHALIVGQDLRDVMTKLSREACQ